MKRFFLFLSGLLFLISCEYQNDSLPTINNNITQVYLLNGNLNVYLQNNQVFRYTGKPGIVRIPIGNADLSKYESCFVLHVATGTTKVTIVSSAIIKLDGQVVLNTSDFSKNNGQFTFEICNLTATSVLTVEVRGEPGSYLDIWIEGKTKIPVNGLVAYYPFNGNADDESGNGNHGTVNGATLTTDRFNIANKAYAFNGTSSTKIAVSDNPSLSFNTQFTLSAWVNISGPWVYSHKWILCKESSPTSGFALGYDQNDYFGIGNYTIDFILWTSSGLNYIHKILTLSEITGWENIVSVTDGTTLKLYLNGDEIMTTTLPSGYKPSSNPLLIGSTSQRSDQNFNGSIDDIRIYNRALSSAEINAIYHEGGW
jgi:hypothetical protein